MVIRYNGTSWSRVRLPTRDVLYAVWGSSASNVYAAGGDGSLYRYDGTTWIPEKAQNGNSLIHGLWGASSTDVYAAGAGGRSRSADRPRGRVVMEAGPDLT